MKRILFLLFLLPVLAWGQGIVIQQSPVQASGANQNKQVFQWANGRFLYNLALPIGNSATLNNANPINGYSYLQLSDTTLRVYYNGSWLPFGGGSGSSGAIFFSKQYFGGLGTLGSPLTVNNSDSLGHQPPSFYLNGISSPNAIISGGVTNIVGTNILGVGPTTYRLNNVILTKSSSTFFTLNPSTGGLSHYEAVYGDGSGVLSRIIGLANTAPTFPPIPPNTLLIGYALVTPGGAIAVGPPVTIYSGDGTITQNRSVYLGGNNFTITDTTNNSVSFFMQPSATFPAIGISGVNPSTSESGTIAVGSNSSTVSYTDTLGNDSQVLTSSIAAQLQSQSPGNSGYLISLNGGSSATKSAELTDNYNFRGYEYNHAVHYTPNAYTLLSKYMADSLYAASGGSGVTSFNTRTGAVTLTSGDVTGALGFTPVTNARTVAGFALSGNVTLATETYGTGLVAGSYNGSTAATAKVDTTAIQTIANFFPKGDTRYAKIGGGTLTNSLTFGTGLVAGSYNNSTAVAEKVDTAVLQTVLNFFPKGDTRYLKSATISGLANPTASIGFTPINGTATTGTRSDGAPKADSTVIRSVANSYSLSGMQTKLNNYVLGTTTVAGFPLSSNVTLANLTATDATLTFSGTYTGATARTIGLNLGNANTWSALQTFNGSFISGSTNTNQYLPVLASATSTAVSQYQIGGATTTFFRSGFYGNASTSLTAGTAGANVIFGNAGLTSVASGTANPLIANVAIMPVTITNGGIPPTLGASLVITAAPSNATTNWALDILSGASNFQAATFAGAITANSNISGSGNILATGILSSSAGSTSANFTVGGATLAASYTTASYLFGGASTVFNRSVFNGSTSTMLTTGASYSNVIVASAPFTKFSSGTHTWAANLVVNPLGAIGTGSATLTNTASLFVGPAYTGSNPGTNNYTAYFDVGNVQVANGNLTLGTAGNKINITTGTNASAGTGTLSGGTVTISTTAVTASSLIFLTDTNSSIVNVGSLTVSSKSAGVSFTVNSTNIADTSTFNWFIVN